MPHLGLNNGYSLRRTKTKFSLYNCNSYKLGVFILFLVCCTSCSKDDEFDVYPEGAVFRVLDIGNSYSNDATAYLPYLVKELHADVRYICLYKATKGGASFRDWYNIYHNEGSYYEVSKVFGGLKANVEEGRAEAKDGSLFRRLLSNEKWDMIIIHQFSKYATLYEEWNGQGPSGYLKELLGVIKYYQPDCTIGFMLIHSYDDDYSGNEEHSSYERWSNLARAAQQFVQVENTAVVIPYGTAIQNLRETRFNDDMELTRDGTHLGLGLARYTAACCYYETLIAPRTGVSILGKNIPFSLPDDPETSQYGVTHKNMETAQKAAVLALQHPFLCLNPDSYSIDELKAGVHL